MILDGAAIGVMLFGEPLAPDAYLKRFYPDLEIPTVARVAERTVPLIGRINQSQWIASCPCGAKGVPTPGGLVWRLLPIVWCVRCENAAVGGLWRPVALPPDADRLAIEAVLLCRPRPETRNWDGETIDELVAQNREHGDPAPGDDDAPAGLGPRPTAPSAPVATAFSPLPTVNRADRRPLLRGGAGR